MLHRWAYLSSDRQTRGVGSDVPGAAVAFAAGPAERVGVNEPPPRRSSASRLQSSGCFSESIGWIGWELQLFNPFQAWPGAFGPPSLCSSTTLSSAIPSAVPAVELVQAMTAWSALATASLPRLAGFSAALTLERFFAFFKRPCFGDHNRSTCARKGCLSTRRLAPLHLTLTRTSRFFLSPIAVVSTPVAATPSADRLNP